MNNDGGASLCAHVLNNSAIITGRERKEREEGRDEKRKRANRGGREKMSRGKRREQTGQAGKKDALCHQSVR